MIAWSRGLQTFSLRPESHCTPPRPPWPALQDLEPPLQLLMPLLGLTKEQVVKMDSQVGGQLGRPLVLSFSAEWAECWQKVGRHGCRTCVGPETSGLVSYNF